MGRIVNRRLLRYAFRWATGLLGLLLVGGCSSASGNHPTSPRAGAETARSTSSTASLWQVASGPSAGVGLEEAVLRDIACASSTDCWAVGGWEAPWSSPTAPGSLGTPLIEVDTGGRWTVANGPNRLVVQEGLTVSLQGQLRSVTCLTSADCWAVGATDSDPTTAALIETNS